MLLSQGYGPAVTTADKRDRFWVMLLLQLYERMGNSNKDVKSWYR